MSLPSFTIAGTLLDLLGNTALGEIVGNGLGGATPAKVTFTSNVPASDFVTFDGVAYRVDEVTATVGSDGSITRNGDPVKLLANDDGLSVDGVQWQAHVAGMKRFWFNAPTDGGTVDLASVAPVPGVSLVGLTTLDWNSVTGKPAVVAEGADAAAARASIGAVGLLNNRAVAIGDSITAANSTGYIALQGDMWFNHLCIDTEQRIQYAGYFATSGYTLANIRTNHLPTVLAMNPLPGACAVFGGTNDMSAWGTGGASFTASKTTLRAIVASLLAVGVLPMLCTIPPITNSTDAVNQNTVTWNTWVRRYAAASGFPLIDASAALLGSNGQYVSGLGSGDGVHPNQKGHRLIAQRAIDDGVYEPFPPARVRTSRSSADLSNMFGSGSASYGLFLANSGGVGTGLTASGTGYTASIVAAAEADDLQGNWQQLSRTTGNTGTATLTSGSLTGGWSVGDVLAFMFRVQAEGLNESSTTFYVMLWNGAASEVSHAGLYLFESDVDGLFYVEIPVPAGAAFQFWELQMSAVGGTGNPTVRVGEVTVRNLTTGGILT